MLTEDEHYGKHLLYSDEGKWERCYGCDYLEPIGMFYLPEGESHG